MIRTIKPPRFLLSSYILGAVAAFAAAGLLDYWYFDHAVTARETTIRQRHRAVLKSHDDYLEIKFQEERQKACELATADASDQINSLSAKLKEIAGVAEARQKLLDIKNRQLRDLETQKRQIREFESVVRQWETKNKKLENQLASATASQTTASIGLRLANGVFDSLTSSSASLQSMRDEWNRQARAEAEGRKKPKGPVYLNTPRGRVILVPAG
jgi:myosin heavy subunit